MCATIKGRIKAAAVATLRERQLLRTSLLRAVAMCGRSLVLCYHTVEPAADHRLVPALPPDQFDQQIHALKSVGDIVPLDWLLHRRRSLARPQLALTFDDDDPAHVRHVLPILQKHQIHATFFLSGRLLHGLGAYWWTRLEQSVRTIGLAATCHALGVYAPTVKELVRRCRNSARVKELPFVPPGPLMTAADIRLLSGSGMAIGFHTLHHPALTRLEDRDLSEAVTKGRDALAAAAGAQVELFAYPYGTFDHRVANAVRAKGYRAAFGLGDRPVLRAVDRFCVPRWQPGSVCVSDMGAEAAVRLIQAPA